MSTLAKAILRSNAYFLFVAAIHFATIPMAWWTPGCAFVACVLGATILEIVNADQ